MTNHKNFCVYRLRSLQAACALEIADGAAKKKFKNAVLTALNARMGSLLDRPTNALKAACLDPRQSRLLRSLFLRNCGRVLGYDNRGWIVPAARGKTSPF